MSMISIKKYPQIVSGDVVALIVMHGDIVILPANSVDQLPVAIVAI